MGRKRRRYLDIDELEDKLESQLNRCIPKEPTSFAPGTPEKIQVMATRHSNGELLYHPDDEVIVTHADDRDLPPGIYRRVRGNSSDLWVSTYVGGNRVMKRFRNNEIDLAINFLKNHRESYAAAVKQELHDRLFSDEN